MPIGRRGRIGLALGALAVGAGVYFARRGTARAAAGDPPNMRQVQGALAAGAVALKIKGGAPAVVVVHDDNHAQLAMDALRPVAGANPELTFYHTSKALVLSLVPDGVDVPADIVQNWGGVGALEGGVLQSDRLWSGDVSAAQLRADIDGAAATLTGGLEALAPAEPGYTGLWLY